MGKILVIDDDAQVRTYLRHLLEREGHEVHTADNGKTGTRAYRDTRPDLVVLDVIMPEQEGLETIRKLRAEAPGLKIIAISGGGQLVPETFLDVARRLGAARTLTKPFGRGEFLGAVDELLAAAAV